MIKGFSLNLFGEQEPHFKAIQDKGRKFLKMLMVLTLAIHCDHKTCFKPVFPKFIHLKTLHLALLMITRKNCMSCMSRCGLINFLLKNLKNISGESNSFKDLNCSFICNTLSIKTSTSFKE